VPDLPIYLDHAATTPMSSEVVAAILPYLSGDFGNPSSQHAAGLSAREAVETARETIAEAIGASPDEIHFTSGGTEADNWAIKGVARVAANGRSHILVSAIEHHAVLESANALREAGFTFDRIPVDSDGLVEPSDVASRINNKTLLVSVMHANNEVGSVQAIDQIATMCAESDVPLHVDAVQSLGQIPVRVRHPGIRFLSISGHKLYGPKGVGALYIRRGTRIGPLLDGGGQERGLRAGTLNVPGIVGFGEAVRQAAFVLRDESTRLTDLRDRLIDRVLDAVRSARICGSRIARLPNNAHFCFAGLEGEALLIALDAAGIIASAGAACSAGATEPSHVLLAMGVPAEVARGAVRLTLGRSTTEEAIDYAAEEIARVVASLTPTSIFRRAPGGTLA
jgi:cysteine desulfurase